MLQLKSNFGLVLLSMTLLAPFASATTITFGTGTLDGFSSGGTTSVTVNDAAGWTGFTATVTAGTTTTCNPTCLVTASAAGYGVDSGGGDIPDIDGSGLLDTLTITFNQAVTLTGITLGNWDNSDNVGIYNGATLLQTYSNNTNVVALSSYGTTFQFQATGSNDDFQIQSITFTTPEPATFGMMGLALLGLGLGARKKIKRA